ncbi:MAG: Fe-S protein assembly co-chaperone HscB [Vicinamibacterales bacterium]
MTPENTTSARSLPMLECRSCGAGAPVHEHFCPQCSRILALGRHGDYFTFFGLPKRLQLDADVLERRFRELSRQFHPDYYYGATPTERLASLERSSYLNDAYRILKNPVSRAEYVLSLEGVRSPSGQPSAVPPGLLEDVFALNEELDEIREQRESGADAESLRKRLDTARTQVEARREAQEGAIDVLGREWDELPDAETARRRTTLEALHEKLLERHYIANLLTTIERELAGL